MPTTAAPADRKTLEADVKSAVDFLALLLNQVLARNGLKIDLNSVRTDKLVLAEYLIYRTKKNVGFFKASGYMPMMSSDEGMRIISFEMTLTILIDDKIAELKIEETGTLEDQKEFVDKVYLQLLDKLGRAGIIE